MATIPGRITSDQVIRAVVSGRHQNFGKLTSTEDVQTGSVYARPCDRRLYFGLALRQSNSQEPRNVDLDSEVPHFRPAAQDQL